jgi:hypothetical protein
LPSWRLSLESSKRQLSAPAPGPARASHTIHQQSRGPFGLRACGRGGTAAQNSSKRGHRVLSIQIQVNMLARDPHSSRARIALAAGDRAVRGRHNFRHRT